MSARTAFSRSASIWWIARPRAPLAAARRVGSSAATASSTAAISRSIASVARPNAEQELGVVLPGEAREQGLDVAFEIRQLESLGLEDTRLSRVDQRGARTWDEDRARHAELPVRGPDLRVVGDLGRAADVASGGKEVILGHGPEQGARAPGRGVTRQGLSRLLPAHAEVCPPHLDHVAFDRERAALPLRVPEQAQEPGPNRNLLVIPGLDQPSALLGRHPGHGRALGQLAIQDGCHQGLQLVVSRIDDDEPREERREQPPERRCEADAWTVAPPQPLDEVVPLRTGSERRSQLVRQRPHGLVEHDLRCGLAHGFVRRAVTKRSEGASVVEHGREADLGEVVVVGGDPEDGNDRLAPQRLKIRGEPHRGGGLEEHIDRAAEEAGLLSGDEHCRVRAFDSSCAATGLGGFEALLLPDDGARQGGTVARDGARPVRRCVEHVEVPPRGPNEGLDPGIALDVMTEEKVGARPKSLVAEKDRRRAGHAQLF